MLQKSLRKFYIDLVEGRRRGIFVGLIKLFLFFLSLLYGSGINLRNYLYDKGILKGKISKIPLVSIGNITWGGTGKTSLVMKLTLSLSEFKVACLVRGYGQDEVSLIKEALKGSDSKLFVGKNRLKLLESLDYSYNLAILDDGFQYRAVKKNLEIVLLNGKDPWGSGYLLPRGKLREPLKGLKRADVFIIMHSRNQQLERFLRDIKPSSQVFYGRYVPLGLRDFKGVFYHPSEFLQRRVACFAALGWPESFLDSLKELGIYPYLNFIYPDHYLLEEKEFRKIEEECLASKIKDLIITSKDRIRFKFPSQLSIFILEVSLDIENYQELLALIKERIKNDILVNKNYS